MLSTGFEKVDIFLPDGINNACNIYDYLIMEPSVTSIIYSTGTILRKSLTCIKQEIRFFPSTPYVKVCGNR